MYNTEKANTARNDGQEDSEEPKGRTWRDPGKFPEFNGGDIQLSTEEKDEVGERAEQLFERIDKLKLDKVPEGKFKLPLACYDKIIKEIQSTREISFPESVRKSLRIIEYKVDELERLDGTVEKDIGERLWSLFEDPEISVGIHGTIAEADSNLGSEDSPFFASGVGCRYGDLRKTIAFQDRGKIHAHGEISFPELLSYNHPASLQKQPLTLKKKIIQKKEVNYGTHKQTRTSLEEIEVPARQFSAIVAIPKSFETTDSSLRGEAVTIAINNPFAKDEQRSSLPLKGEFVVGVVSDSDPNNIVWNPSFDAGRVRELSRQRKVEDETGRTRKASEVQHNQTTPQPTAEKERPTGIVRGLLNIFRKHN